MKKTNVFLMVGFTAAAAAGLLAYQQYKVQQSADAQLQEVKECSSCTARHKAYSKAKKSWAKTKKSDD